MDTLNEIVIRPEDFENLTYDDQRELLLKFAERLQKQPKPKVVDLSVVRWHDIPMEFSNGDGYWRVGFLDFIWNSKWPYQAYGGRSYKRCRFDFVRPVAWFGGLRPLPDGVITKVWLRNGTLFDESMPAVEYLWGHDNSPEDIIAFQVTGLAPGWRYPWE